MKPALSFIVFIFLFENAKAQCSASAPKDPAAFSNNVSAGTVVWTNLSNAATSNHQYASAPQALGLFSSANTNYLVCSNHGFSIPPAATICGIQVSIEASVGGLGLGASVKDNSVRIVKSGSITGTEHALAANWSSTNVSAVYGGANDLWGTLWTAADISAPDFGVAVSAKLSSGAISLLLTPQIDHVSITVYYFAPLLPVEPENFSAKKMADKVKVEWTTGAETAKDIFVLEKSFNKISWFAIDSISQVNSGVLINHYTFDNSPGATNYYRLKKADNDGRVSFSKILAVEFAGIASSIAHVYPNPVSSALTINCPAKIKDVRFFSANSAELAPPPYREDEKGRTYNVSKLKAGIYLLRIQLSQQVLTQKIVIVQ